MTAYLADSNIWIALAIADHGQHASAQRWFDALPDTDSVLFCRETQQTFMRLLTTATVHAPFGEATPTNNDAWALYDRILEDPRIRFQEPEPASLQRRWRQYSQRNTASPKLWMDAYLAAFARAEGCTMVTTDAAFKQFSGLELLLIE